MGDEYMKIMKTEIFIYALFRCINPHSEVLSKLVLYGNFLTKSLSRQIRDMPF